MAVESFTDLSKGRQQGEERVPVRRCQSVDHSRAYTTADIEGAQAGTWRRPKSRGNRPSSSLCTHDIAGAQCSVLVPKKPNKRGDLSLNCGDVIGAAPSKRIWTRRCTNPNTRDYGYPLAAEAPATPCSASPARQIPNCADITTYVPQIRVKPAARQMSYLDYSDVAGSKPRNPKAQFHPNVGDKTVHSYTRKVGDREGCNPLDPVYIYDVPAEIRSQGKAASVNWAMAARSDSGFRPKKGRGLRRQQALSMSMSLSGIEGAHPADPWLPLHFPQTRRSPKRRTNDVTDIPGATRGKKVGSMQTSGSSGLPCRVTDPNNPSYVTYSSQPRRAFTAMEVREAQDLLNDIESVRNLS